jgi:DNA-binding CsgD family transcriptional regulator
LSSKEETIEELAAGVAHREDGALVCLCCGKVFAPDEIFPADGRFYTAARAAALHVQQMHPSRFQEFVSANARSLSITENQKELLQLFHDGVPDSEIAKQLHISQSTVRHQRFRFREKAKNAKLYLAVWKMAEKGKIEQQAELLPVHKGAKMVDDRYAVTKEEYETILENVFESQNPLKLKVFSSKEKKKIVILHRLAEEFEPGRQYTEKEVNRILGSVDEDYAMLRRYLVEYGYLGRTRDCSRYWRK